MRSISFSNTLIISKILIIECLEGAELDLIMACDGKKFMVQVKSSYYTKRGKSKSDTEQYTKRRFAHFGNSKNADYSKMIVVCIYMHSFEPFQLKQNGEYDVSNKKKRNEVMQRSLWILPGEKYNRSTTSA